MNDIDIMKRAKSYMESLANGRDPLTGNDLPESDIVNNVRISRCLFYVADVLQKVIDNGGEVQREKLKRADKADFALTDEQTDALTPFSAEASLSKVVGRINDLIDPDIMKKLRRKDVVEWLKEKGLLKEVVINGRTHNDPTPEGELIGIKLSDYRTFEGNMVKTCVYTPEAQQFIFDNIEVIIEFASQE